MTVFCGQVNIPTVNNDAIACKNYYDTNCVIYQDPIPYFGFTDPSTSTEVFNAIISSLTDARSRIVTLEGASGITFDLVPTDGSTNAVQSNGIFDALALKLEDAPSDGNQYVRINGTWAQIVGASNVLVGDNVAVATNPLPAYTTGAGNTSFGDRSLENASTINGVVALGDMAGFYAANTESPVEGVTTELTVATDGIFIGAEAKPSANNSTGEIVIGARAHGNGNNTTTIGGFTNVETYLRGDVIIEAAGGTGSLDVAGTALFNSGITVNGNIGVTGTVDGRDIAVDGTKLDGIEAGATADQIAAEVPIADVGSFFTATDVEGALQELGAAAGGITDGDKGDITVSGSGATWTIDPQAVTFGKIQNVTTGIFAGRISSGTGSLEELSGADATTLLSPFSTTTAAQGVVPGSSGLDATYFLNATGTWTQPAGGGGGSTIYSANDSLTGTRTVDLATFELQFDNAGNTIYINNGRLGVSTPVFGGSRLGDSFLQTPSIDTQSINIKDNSLNTFLAIFSSAVGAVPGDGVVTTMKNFTDSVNVISIAGQDANQASGTRQVESTLGLRNDYQDNSFTVLDMFNQDYPASGTPVAQRMGWVAIHGGGAAAKPMGLWRYDGTTYTNIWELGATNVLTYNVDINVPDEAYGVSWAGSTEVPTKGALYTQIESIDTSSFVTLGTAQSITGQKTFTAQQNFTGVVDMQAGTPQTQGIQLFPHTPPASPTGSYLQIGADNSNRLYLNPPTSTLQAAIDPNSITADRVYTLPDASGTLLIDADLNDLVTVSTGQTITGSKSFSSILTLTGDAFRIDDGQIGFIPQDSFTGLTTSYASLRFRTTPANTWEFSNPSIASSGVFRFNANSLTGIRTYTMPDNSGTLALLSDVGATTLAGLGDVTITGATTGEYLRYNGSAWVDSTIQEADIPTLSAYVATTGDNMTGALTMSANILADTGSTRDIGAFATPFFETYSRRFIIKKGTSNKSWRLEGNIASDDLQINIEATANTNTWLTEYTFNATGAPVNPTDIVDLAYLEANFMELTGNQTAAGIKTFSDSTASTTKDTGAVVLANGGLGVEGAINAGGDITAFASSDPRLKDDMVRISNPMDIIGKLSGYNFVWNGKQSLYTGEDIGLNAFEVQDVIPSAVRKSSKTVGGWLQVDYKKVIPPLVEAVKEKDSEIKELKSQLQLQGQLLTKQAAEIEDLKKMVHFLMKKID